MTNEANNIIAGNFRPADEPGDTAPVFQAPVGTEEALQLALAALPGLVGAMDTAIKEQTGEFMQFTLLIYGNGQAIRCSNFNPDAANEALLKLAGGLAQELMKSAQPVEAADPGTVPVINGHGAIEPSNDGEAPPSVGTEPPHATH